MFIQRKEEDEIAAAVERLLSGEAADIKNRIIAALSSLSDEHWLLIDQKLREIVGTREVTPTVEQEADEIPAPTVEEQANEAADKVREQYISERGPGSPASSANGTAGG